MGRFHPAGRLSSERIVAATGAELIGGQFGGDWTLCTDSREMGDGALFVALEGENFDGHRFVAEVLSAYRCGAIVHKRPADDVLSRARGPVLLVQDSLVALGSAASSYCTVDRRKIVAVTGSVGKTTTRAMIASILSQRSCGLQTEGNFNNRIGLPLTLLTSGNEDNWAVLEMGMSEPGEIRTLAAMVEPAVRVITEVAAAHLEFFDSIEGIADAKGELFLDAQPGDSLIFPADNPLSNRFVHPPGTRSVGFSLSPDAGTPVKALRIEDLGAKGSQVSMRWMDAELSVHLPIPGRHQVGNALAAAAAAWVLGATGDEVVAGLEGVELPGRRMQIYVHGAVQVIDDAYNANPASVKAALDTLASFPAQGRRVAALGDMLELGADGPSLHAEAGAHAADLGIDLLVGTGELMVHAVGAARAAGTEALEAVDSEEAGQLLASRLTEGDVLLLKGSRGVRMERALTYLPNSQEG